MIANTYIYYFPYNRDLQLETSIVDLDFDGFKS